MNVIGILLIAFGVVVIAAPALIAYLIGIFFILIGLNMVVLSLAFRKNTNKSFRVGPYEIFRK